MDEGAGALGAAGTRARGAQADAMTSSTAVPHDLNRMATLTQTSCPRQYTPGIHAQVSLR